eukprot:ctg_302.g129
MLKSSDIQALQRLAGLSGGGCGRRQATPTGRDGVVAPALEISNVTAGSGTGNVSFESLSRSKLRLTEDGTDRPPSPEPEDVDVAALEQTYRRQRARQREQALVAARAATPMRKRQEMHDEPGDEAAVQRPRKTKPRNRRRPLADTQPRVLRANRLSLPKTGIHAHRRSSTKDATDDARDFRACLLDTPTHIVHRPVRPDDPHWEVVQLQQALAAAEERALLHEEFAAAEHAERCAADMAHRRYLQQTHQLQQHVASLVQAMSSVKTDAEDLLAQWQRHGPSAIVRHLEPALRGMLDTLNVAEHVMRAEIDYVREPLPARGGEGSAAKSVPGSASPGEEHAVPDACARTPSDRWEAWWPVRETSIGGRAEINRPPGTLCTGTPQWWNGPQEASPLAPILHDSRHDEYYVGNSTPDPDMLLFGQRRHPYA